MVLGGVGIMTAKEYLRQLKTLDNVINAKLLEKERMRALATRVSTNLTEKVQGGVVGGFENTLIKIDELEKSIDVDVDKLVGLRDKARSLIDKLSDNNYKAILSMYYVSNATFEQMAEYMNYSVAGIFKMHGNAISEFNDIYQKNVKSEKSENESVI
nr:MAG TPA: Protein of unknown function (DUF1492) [Caudoviricetes sp.]